MVFRLCTFDGSFQLSVLPFESGTLSAKLDEVWLLVASGDYTANKLTS